MDETSIEIHPVTPERLADLEELFESTATLRGCRCMIFRAGVTGKVPPASGPERKKAMRALVRAGTPVGLLAYLEGKPVGWCSVAPRSTFPPLGVVEAPAEPIWSITCFYVRPELRGQGLQRRLLDAAIREARAQGARTVEAYPVDADSPSYRFGGVVLLFEKAGFREVGRRAQGVEALEGAAPSIACYFAPMDVTFRRTGDRRYAVLIDVEGQPTRTMDPAPAFDPHIPHDLVHYVVEAELGFTKGVFGRAARGGGTFWAMATSAGAQSSRERERARRKQLRRETSLRHADEARERDMIQSERLAGICDVLWRREHGQRPDPLRPAPQLSLSPEDAARAARVVARLTELAPAWNQLPVGGELVFTWPGLTPRVRVPQDASRGAERAAAAGELRR